MVQQQGVGNLQCRSGWQVVFVFVLLIVFRLFSCLYFYMRRRKQQEVDGPQCSSDWPVVGCNSSSLSVEASNTFQLRPQTLCPIRLNRLLPLYLCICVLDLRPQRAHLNRLLPPSSLQTGNSSASSTPIPLWISPFESLKPKAINWTPTLLFFHLSEARPHLTALVVHLQNPAKALKLWASIAILALNEWDWHWFSLGVPSRVQWWAQDQYVSQVQTYVYAKPSKPSHRNQPSTGGTSDKGLKFQYSRAQFRDISVIFSNVWSQVKTFIPV